LALEESAFCFVIEPHPVPGAHPFDAFVEWAEKQEPNSANVQLKADG
jgi:hypothetical protein